VDKVSLVQGWKNWVFLPRGFKSRYDVELWRYKPVPGTGAFVTGSRGRVGRHATSRTSVLV